MVEIRTLFILGSGGHAVSVMDAALSAGFDVRGFVDSGAAPIVCGLPVLPSVEETGGTAFALGVGTNFAREKIFTQTKDLLPQAEFPAIVHATAYVSPLATLEEASVVLALANVGPQTRVGLGALVNTGASVDHDSVLEAWSSLGPGAHTGGNVFLGVRSVVGLQAGISHGVTIGPDSVVGAHSFVHNNIDANIVAYGVPAKIIRGRQRDDPYY